MSNVTFEMNDINNLNNLGVGYLFEKELNIKDDDINKMLENLDNQLKQANAQEELKSLFAEVNESKEPKGVEPDFWAMTEEWAKKNNPQIESITSNNINNLVDIPKHEVAIKQDNNVFESKNNNVAKNEKDTYIQNQSSLIQPIQNTVKQENKNQVQLQEQNEVKTTPLSTTEKKDIDVNAIIMDRRAKMDKTHLETVEAAEKTGNLKTINYINDRNRVEQLDFDVKAKEIRADYLSETFEKQDIEMARPKSEIAQERNAVKSDISNPDFGKRNNTIQETHPSLDYGLLMNNANQKQDISKLEPSDTLVNKNFNPNKEQSSTGYKQPRNFFNNYNIAGEGKTMRDHMDWQKDDNNLRGNSLSFDQYWNDARKNMTEVHKSEREQALLNGKNALNIHEKKVDVETKLFNVYEKQAEVEKREFFSQGSSNPEYKNYHKNPELAKATFGPSRQDKQELHQAHTDYYLTANNLKLDKEIDPGRAMLHKEQTNDLMNSTPGTDDWKHKEKTHAVENYNMDYRQGKVEQKDYNKNMDTVLRQNLEPGKNYDVRVFDGSGLTTVKFTGQETKQPEQKQPQVNNEINSNKIEQKESGMSQANPIKIEKNLDSLKKQHEGFKHNRDGNGLKDLSEKSSIKSGVVSNQLKTKQPQQDVLSNKQKTDDFKLENAKKPNVNLDERESNIKMTIKHKQGLGY